MPKKIFIGGLSATATESSLERMFAQFGPVLTVQILTEPSTSAGPEVQTFGQNGGAVVTFADDAAGDQAIEEMNGVELDGRTLTVRAVPEAG